MRAVKPARKQILITVCTPQKEEGSGSSSSCTWVAVSSLVQEEPLEEGMATAWTEETGGLQSIESQRVRHDLSDLAHSTAFHDTATDKSLLLLVIGSMGAT